MSDQKKTNPWAEDVEKLTEVLETYETEQREKQMRALGDHLEFMEKRIYAALGIPKEFIKDCKVEAHVHDSVAVSVPASSAKQIAAAINQNNDVHSLAFAAKNYVGGRQQGSIPVKNVHVDKKLLWGLLYGSHPGVSMGASVAAVQAQINHWPGRKHVFPSLKGTASGRFSSHQPNPVQHPSFIRGRRRHEQFLKSVVVTGGLQQNRGTYKVVKVIDECQVYLEPVGTGIMCQPVLQEAVFGVAGYEPVCAECQHGIHCLRGKHPNVCSHCRATVPQHVAGQHSFDGRIEAEYCRLQIAEERVSSSCPLFKYSLMVCAHCREPRPYVTRVRIPDRKNLRTARFKTVKVRRVPATQKTFREHLLQHQKGRGDLHQRQQARHNRKPHGKTNQQQAQRRPGRRAKKRRA